MLDNFCQLFVISCRYYLIVCLALLINFLQSKHSSNDVIIMPLAGACLFGHRVRSYSCAELWQRLRFDMETQLAHIHHVYGI